MKLKNLKSKLDVYNDQFQSLRIADVDDKTLMNDEFSACNEYDDKIADCLSILECESNANSSDDTARSLLRNPIAPLPSFYSKEGEDITKFFLHFQDAIAKFKYTASDKFFLD